MGRQFTLFVMISAFLISCDETGSPEYMIVGEWQHISDSTKVNGVVYVSYPFEWGVENETIQYFENGSFTQTIEYRDTTNIFSGAWELDHSDLQLVDDGGGKTRVYELYVFGMNMTLSEERVSSGEPATLVARYRKIE